jgi:predicted RNase H-related nuclease YkuK (DUF458 family)
MIGSNMDEMSLLDKTWLAGSGEIVLNNSMFQEINEYINEGGKIFVGTDSQIGSDGCIFVTAICLHKSCGKRYATYFYHRSKEKETYRGKLRFRIMKEVQKSVDVSLEMLEIYPSADIEIHVDIGKTSRSQTRTFVDPVKGWLTGVGFGCKIKPNSWASSAVADHHTK